jgi:hypothetical protein
MKSAPSFAKDDDSALPKELMEIRSDSDRSLSGECMLRPVRKCLPVVAITAHLRCGAASATALCDVIDKALLAEMPTEPTPVSKTN